MNTTSKPLHHQLRRATAVFEEAAMSNLREKPVFFGTISGGFNLQVEDDGAETKVTVCSFEGDSYPVRWTLEGNIRITDEEMSELKGKLESFARIFDKKMSEAIGSFISQKRSQK
jgi:hypothetical protein